MSTIDYVIINNKPTSINVINKLKPDVYCKGSDYKNHKKDLTGQIKNELFELKKMVVRLNIQMKLQIAQVK